MLGWRAASSLARPGTGTGSPAPSASSTLTRAASRTARPWPEPRARSWPPTSLPGCWPTAASAGAAGLGNVEFVEAQAASLNFPSESFDAALSRFGIIFEPEAEAAAARVRGFLVPGSRMVISSWGPPGRVPFVAVPMGTAMRTLGVDPPPPGTPGPLSRPTPEALGGLLEGGGFSDVEVEETEVSFKWESADEFVAMVKDTSPPLVALIAKHAPDDPDRAWDAILGAVKETASDDGTVTFSNLVLLAVGRA